MDTKYKKIPFPQANDFNKVLRILDKCEDDQLKNKEYVKEIIEIGTLRQVDYYLNACRFLGLIEEYHFTKFGLYLKTSSYEEKITNLCSQIIKMPVFSDVFMNKFLYNIYLNDDVIGQLICDNYSIENYDVCKRRSSTVRKWIDWIFTIRKDFQEWN